MELKDPDSLKCNILQLLINYPTGLKFADFSRTFYQTHRFHPRFSHYGYHSLRELLDDMKETVVVEGSKPGGLVMRLVPDLNFDALVEEIEKIRLNSFEEEDPRLKEEERRKREEDAAAADLAEILAAITNLLLEYRSGLKLEKIQKLLLSTSGIDLQSFSISKGYKDIVAFLDHQIPRLIIKHRRSLQKCVVRLSKDLTVASVPICSILKLYPDGLKLAKLKEAVKKKCGYDLEVFCYQVGFSNIVSCLCEIPELVIIKNKNRNCTVQLKPASFSCSSSQSSHCPSFGSEQPTCTSKNGNQAAPEKKPVPFSSSSSQSSHSSSFDSDQSTCISNNSNQDESGKTPGLDKVRASVTALVTKYTSGLKIKKLQDLLREKEGIDLEQFSFAFGHKDTLEFLEKRMPQLMLNYRMDRLNSVVIKRHSGTADPVNSLPAPFNCFTSQSSHSSSSESDQPTCTSNNSNQDEFGKMPELGKVMALVTDRLTNYKNGLRIWKLQDFLLAQDGFDLEKFSIAQGYKDTMDFLEQNMPQLMLNYQVDRLNTVAIETHSDLEDNSKPASTVSDPTASNSQCQNIPASITVGPPEVNSSLRTNQSCPSTMSSNLPSFHESPNTLSVKAKSSSFSTVVLSQQPSPPQPSAKSVTVEIPSNSQVTTFQPSSIPEELKQQVAQILSKHPKGLSLFQFRLAYSTIFKEHFPMGDAASAKQYLLKMPDIVCVKGHGVQTLLLPVSPDVSPAKSGQPASSKVDNAAVLSSLSLVPVPVTKPAVKTFDSHSVLTSDSPEKPESKDCSISEDLSLSRLPAPCQEQKKARTGMAGFSRRLDSSKEEDIPVLPGCPLPQAEALIVPQSFLTPVVPTAATIPIPEPHHSFLQYKENKPYTEFHAQSTPASIKVTEMNKSHLNGPGPKLEEIPFIPHCSAALPTYYQGTVCGETLQPGIPKSRFASPTESNISDAVPSVDSTPVSPVSVKPSEIHSPRSAPQSSNSIQPRHPVPPPPPILSTGQRNYNRASAEFDSFSEVQKQSGALQHFSSPDSSAKRSSVSSLPRNTASCLLSRSQLNHQLQQPAHARLGNLESTPVSSAAGGLGKASLNRVSPAATCPRRPTYVNPLEASSTTESFTACSVSGSLHNSSVITTNSRASSSVSLRTRAVSPAASPLDSIANSYDQMAYASARIASNSSPLRSETTATTQQRQYVRAAATGFPNTRAPRPTSWSPESIASSHHQFAYASSRITTNSSNLSSETYAFTHQRQSTQASETTTASSTKTASSISSPGSTPSLPHQHASASARATSTPSVLSRPTAYPIPNADVRSNLNFDPPIQNNLTFSPSNQEHQSASWQEKQVPDTSLVPKLYKECVIL